MAGSKPGLSDYGSEHPANCATSISLKFYIFVVLVGLEASDDNFL